MYQFSRSIYRAIAPYVVPGAASPERLSSHRAVLGECEGTIERLANDGRYFAHPERSLFSSVRVHVPIASQARVYRLIESHLTIARAYFRLQAMHGVDVDGNPLQCRATTRRGEPCQRAPRPRNGYCPSHKHLAEAADSIAGRAA